MLSLSPVCVDLKEAIMMFDLTPYTRRHNDSICRSFYDPFRELEALQRSFFSGNDLPAFRTDVKDQGDSYLLEAELPGFKREDIHLDVNDDTLTISAERKSESEDKEEDGKYVKRERSYGSFCRSFDLTGINADAIKAAYVDGILKLTLPKQVEQPKAARRLEIE